MKKCNIGELSLVLLITVVVFTGLLSAFFHQDSAEAQARAINFSQEERKIDQLAVDGLTGTVDSLAHQIGVIKQHHHARTRWFGKKASQSETDAADNVLTPFVAISASDAYGDDHDGAINAIDEATIFGTADTPAISGMVYFDLHELLIVAVDDDTPYKLRIVYGTGTRANAVGLGQYSEVVVTFDSVNPQHSAGIPVEINMPRLAVDTKVWIEAWNASDNSTISFLVGIHEYEG